MRVRATNGNGRSGSAVGRRRSSSSTRRCGSYMLHARDAEATVTLERLLEGTRREREGYKRRRVRVEEEAERERVRQEVERQRVALRRKRRQLGRKRERMVQRKRLKVGVQTDVRQALVG